MKLCLGFNATGEILMIAMMVVPDQPLGYRTMRRQTYIKLGVTASGMKLLFGFSVISSACSTSTTDAASAGRLSHVRLVSHTGHCDLRAVCRCGQPLEDRIPLDWAVGTLLFWVLRD